MTWLRLLAGNVAMRLLEWRGRGFLFGPALIDRIKAWER